MANQRRFFIGYQKRDSFFHGLDPISKLVWVACFAILIFTTSAAFWQLILVLVVAMFVRFAAAIRMRDLATIVWAVASLSLSFFLLQILLVDGSTRLATIAGIRITWEAANHAGAVALRQLGFLGVGVAFVDSTDPYDLGLALTQKLKVHYRFSFLMFLTLSLLPVLEKELMDLRLAYKLRYPQHGNGFVSSILLVQKLASAMIWRGLRRSLALTLSIESRAFDAYLGRTYSKTIVCPARGKLLAGLTVLASLLWLTTRH
jgi:energy-coupling factor transport system permease protein